jgi:hypothetical protein
VTHNVVDAKGALIKVGIGEGNVWFCDIYNPYQIESGATVTANILEGKHMGYGFAVSGVSDWRVTGNLDRSAHVGYIAVKVCDNSARNSRPAGFQVQSATHSTLQRNFARHQQLSYLLGLSVRPPTIVLRAHATGLFVSADAAGTKPLIANTTSAGPSEQFRVKYLRHGYIQLRAVADNRWVTAPRGGSQPLIASSTTAGRAQTFKLIRHRDGSVSLLSLADRKYVTVLHSGNLIARATAVHRAQEFDLLGWCLRTAACPA